MTVNLFDAVRREERWSIINLSNTDSLGGLKLMVVERTLKCIIRGDNTRKNILTRQSLLITGVFLYVRAKGSPWSIKFCINTTRLDYLGRGTKN